MFHSLGFHTVFQILWIGRASTIRVRKYTWQGSKMKKQKEKKIIQWHEYSFHMYTSKNVTWTTRSCLLSEAAHLEALSQAFFLCIPRLPSLPRNAKGARTGPREGTGPLPLGGACSWQNFGVKWSDSHRRRLPSHTLCDPPNSALSSSLPR